MTNVERLSTALTVIGKAGRDANLNVLADWQRHD